MKKAVLIASPDHESEATEMARALSKAAGYPRTCLLSTRSLVPPPRAMVVNGYSVRKHPDGAMSAVILDAQAERLPASTVDVDGKPVSIDTRSAVVLDDTWSSKNSMVQGAGK